MLYINIFRFLVGYYIKDARGEDKLKNNNSEKKRNFFKKIAWLIIWVFFFTLVYIPKKQVNANEIPIQGNTNEIKILEIEPGNQFLLGRDSELTLIGDCQTQTVNGKNVEITHVTMAQFISMVDEISGKYDIVVVGRKNSRLANNYYKDNPYLATISTSVPYRDYTNPLSQKREYLPLSTWESRVNWKKSFSTVDNIKFGEYYAENDITKKRADEIIKMIDTKQLVYMDNSIFNSTGNKAINNTKLYSLFVNKASTNNNFIKDQSLANIEINDIIDKYSNISQELKRPQVNQVMKPIDDSKVIAAVVQNRNMKFNITLDGQKSETLTANLYLDINADGLFKDVELVKSMYLQEIQGQSRYELDYTLDRHFVGYLDWKIEIVKQNGVKTDILGSSMYKALNGKKKIKVLQIRPVDSGAINDAYDSINFSTDPRINDLINSSDLNKDYEISIDSKTVEEVNFDTKFKLNGNYNMVILGFKDSYGQQELNTNVLNELEAFIRTGQSVMFTHDTITPSLTDELKSNTGPKKLTQRFRDYIGQARYLDPYRLNSNKVDEKDIYKTYIKDDDGNLQLTDKEIPHDDFNYNKSDNVSGDNKVSYSLGTTLQGSANGRYDEWTTSWDSITEVRQINKAQINQYPFVLKDLENEKTEIDVAPTHTQWYQLNLEDPDVVPWYNMSSNTFDTGDARNYYYTYSKGNITYSGAGHSIEKLIDKNGKRYFGYPDSELKLFINTMIKAERGANHAPIINCSIPLENTDKDPEINQVAAGKDYYFSIDAEDYEKDNVNIHVIINGAELSSDNIVSTMLLSEANNKKSFQIKTNDTNRTSIKFKIPADQLKEAGGNVNVIVEAEDTPQGAKSSKNYVLKPIKSTSSIDVDFVSALPNPYSYNPNNSIEVKYKITPNDYYYNQSLNSAGAIDEAVLLVDLSRDMSDKQRFSEFKNGIMQILNDDKLNKSIKLGVIGYNGDILVGDRNSTSDPITNVKMKTDNETLVHPLFTIFPGTNEWEGFRKLFQEDVNLYNNISKTDTSRNLDFALRRSDDILTKYGEVGKKKAIVIISSGNLTYSDDEIKTIRSKGYKIITLDISSSADNNIKSTHIDLGGIIDSDITKSDYYTGTLKDKSNYNSPDVDMAYVAASLERGTNALKIIKSAKLNFNLGSNFQPVNDQSTNYEQLVNTKDTYYSIDLTKKINYAATTYKDSSGNTKYIANPFEITFKISPLGTLYGNLGFSGLSVDDVNFENNKLSVYGTDLAQNNNFTYTDVFGDKIKNINTPVIKAFPYASLKHGIYQGMDDNNQPIIKGPDNDFAKGATVTFGAYVDGATNNQPIQIKFDERLTGQNIDLSKFKVFKNENGNLESISNRGSFENGIYTYTPSGLLDSGGKILILYTEVLPNNIGTYTNTLKVYYMPDLNAQITVGNQELPDLF